MLQRGEENPDHPMCLKIESRKREHTWFSRLSTITLFQEALWTHKTAATSENGPWSSVILHEDAFLSLEEQCPSCWWKNFKKKNILKALFFLYNNPSVLHCKISDSPKKGIGLIIFFSKCGVVKIHNDFSKFLLILWFHPKCVNFLRMKGKALIFFFLELNVLRYSDVYLFVSWTFIYVTYSVISQNHCKNSMGLDHPFLESVTDRFMVSGGSSVWTYSQYRIYEVCDTLASEHWVTVTLGHRWDKISSVLFLRKEQIIPSQFKQQASTLPSQKR